MAARPPRRYAVAYRRVTNRNASQTASSHHGCAAVVNDARQQLGAGSARQPARDFGIGGSEVVLGESGGEGPGDVGAVDGLGFAGEDFGEVK